MTDFFSNEVGQTIGWFSLTHILLILGFFTSLVLLWVFGPKLKDNKNEKIIRYILIGLAILFEFKVFESRMLNNSIFRIPLCGIALYGLTYAMAFKNEKVYKIVYFYAFGTLLTYFFFDTVWGLDRWSGWTYFGAHAAIGWFAVYGYRVLGFTPNKTDFKYSVILLAIYAFLAGYGYYQFGGADELFLFHPPVDFLVGLQNANQVFYLFVYSLMALFLMSLMFGLIWISERRKQKKTIN